MKCIVVNADDLGYSQRQTSTAISQRYASAA
jgi:hypothetical protein